MYIYICIYTFFTYELVVAFLVDVLSLFCKQRATRDASPEGRGELRLENLRWLMSSG